MLHLLVHHHRPQILEAMPPKACASVRQHALRRVPEEAPQEIADLVHKCTGDQELRPTAQECAELLGSFLPLGAGRKTSGRTVSGESGKTPSSPTAKSPKGDAPKSSGSNPPA